jgi:iron(III) transport system substrate-binding protein
MHTVNLKKMGLLAPYVSASAQDIPEGLKDKEGYWTGIAARGRVIIYNKEKIGRSEPPSTLKEFLNPQRKGKAAIALPLFGTSATHGTALFVKMGKAKAKEFFQGLKTNSIAILQARAEAP